MASAESRSNEPRPPAGAMHSDQIIYRGDVVNIDGVAHAEKYHDWNRNVDDGW